VGIPDEELHRNAERHITGCDAMIPGRVTYKMMEEAWCMPPNSHWPDRWTGRSSARARWHCGMR
jgi:hypothetical protein